MYEIKNLTNEVQYLFFRSGKECFLAGKDSIQGIRDSEITPVINKMKDRRIIALLEVKNTDRGSAKKSEAGRAPSKSPGGEQKKGTGKTTAKDKK